MNTSAIILAGGFSTRFGQDKGLVYLNNKPLIKYVLEAVDQTVEEKIVVVNSKTQAERLLKTLSQNTKVVIDAYNFQSPLVGVATGLTAAKGKYALLLPCDTPLLSKDSLTLLLDLCINRNAAVPRWPNGFIEPLHAAYQVKPTLEAAQSTLKNGQLDMRNMLGKLGGVRYVSTIVLQQLDPELKMFFNINTPLDLKKAELMLKSQKLRKLKGIFSKNTHKIKFSN